MLLDSGLAVGFWPWAMLHAPYLHPQKACQGRDTSPGHALFWSEKLLRARGKEKAMTSCQEISARYLGVCERIVDGSFVLYASGSVGTTACARPAI